MTTTDPYTIHQRYRMAKLRTLKLQESVSFQEKAVHDLKAAIANLSDARISARHYSTLPAAVYFSDTIQPPPFSEYVSATLKLTLHQAEEDLKAWRSQLIEANVAEGEAALAVDRLPRS